MAIPPRPSGVKTFAADRWVFAPTVSSLTAPSVATDINNAASLDITGQIYVDGTDAPAAETQTGQAPMRAMDTVQYGAIGTAQYNFGNITYAYNPQGGLAVAGTAVAKFPQGTTGFLFRRSGISALTDFAATTQKVDIFPVQFGQSFQTPVGDGQFAEYGRQQPVVITGPVSEGVTLAA